MATILDFMYNATSDNQTHDNKGNMAVPPTIQWSSDVMAGLKVGVLIVFEDGS